MKKPFENSQIPLEKEAYGYIIRGREQSLFKEIIAKNMSNLKASKQTKNLYQRDNQWV